MINAAVFIGEPLYFNKDIKIYPPKIKDVVSNPDYPIFASMFITSQEDIWDMIAEQEHGSVTGKPIEGAPTPFEFFLVNCYQSKDFLNKAIEAIKFFTHLDAFILPQEKMILFTGLEELNKDISAEEILALPQIKDDDDFFLFQNLIRQACGEKEVKPPNPNENPRVALIKAKGRMRERLKKKKGGADSITLDVMLVALCCMDLGLTPLNIGEITYIAASALMKMKQEKERYDTEIRAMTSGFGSKKKTDLKHWVRNLDR